MNRFQSWAPNFNLHLKTDKNKKTNMIPIDNIKTPIAMFMAENDQLATMSDAEWLKETIGQPVFNFQTIEGGHNTFFLGKDMTWLKEDVVEILRRY